jgi:hypothetical protein
VSSKPIIVVRKLRRKKPPANCKVWPADSTVYLYNLVLHGIKISQQKLRIRPQFLVGHTLRLGLAAQSPQLFAVADFSPAGAAREFNLRLAPISPGLH